ncbi:NAD(P)/FAD-dependent oxidoreductase [Salinicola corii]|uniref:NAD(P)/FAD-dependent oxidoreductase n=1 Tax=Salinicola corii TaxID=2606937 RepID=A0A640WID9_9GAMM|nr:FAD-dependent oxidoreductase [Salinicola corii]KAA0020416.1 NAD(P)/FAD-dependent oxidoreductase [Salinicola corii]
MSQKSSQDRFPNASRNLPSDPCSAPTHLVIVGNGMAGHRLLSALLKHPERPERITVLGEESSAAYNRILLSSWLADEIERDALDLPLENIATAGVTWRLGERVVTIDRQRRRIHTDRGEPVDYDRLVLATGSRPALPDVPGIRLGNVGGFRDLVDTTWLTSRPAGSRAVVLGGGLLGLEAAEGLRKRGLAVTVLQRSERLMNRQLDETAASWLRSELEGRGLAIETHARLAACEGDADGNVTTVRLEDGRRLPAACVVVATGITPHTALARQSGLNVARGIVVDATLTTSDPAIHALGECCEFEGRTYGLVDPIWRQVEVLAARLCSQPTGGYRESPCATRLKVANISIYAFGPVETPPGHETLVYADPENGDYRRLLLHDNRLVGAVLYGDTTAGPGYFHHAREEHDLSACREVLLFGADDATRLLAESATRKLEEAA